MLHAHRLSKAYGPQCLLTEVDFTVRAGERVGLVGHNGSGKSTLGKIVAGIETADAGHVQLQRGATVAYLEQDPRFEAALSVRAAACAGLGPWSAAKARFEAASQALDAACEKQMPALLREQSEAAQAVERLGGWHREHEVEAMLTQLGVSGHDRPVTELSGGERRRVALARLLTAAPDIAVLDEPTNHLDIDAVAWLESHLQQHWRGALILITHDRYLLDRVVERTVELDRGQLYSYAGGWQAYLQAKAERQAQAARTEANRQNFLRRELVWLRASPKARTRKNKARVERAEAAQAARPQAAEPKLQLRAQSGPRLGKTLLEMHAAQVGIAGRTLLQDVDFILQEGDRIGIIGPNGAGKSTLLRTLTGELEPLAGRLSVGKHTRFAYLSQTRASLDLEQSVLGNVAGPDKQVWWRGEAVDARGYLERFFFDRDKQGQITATLSGGERARLALAQLLLKPANVLLLDEPSNDLDVMSLSALEAHLVDDARTVLVVTHDRYLLDRVATRMLVFAGQGQLVTYTGGYSDYLTQRPPPAASRAAIPPNGAPRAAKAAAKPQPHAKDQAAAQQVPKDAASAVAPTPNVPPAARSAPKPPRLTVAEERELEALLTTIATAEEKVAQLRQALADPALYRDDPQRAPALQAELAAAEGEVERLLARWEVLEDKRERAMGARSR